MDSKMKFIESLSLATNRSKGQTLFLLELVDNDLFKLLELEEKLANNHVNYCPGDREEVEKVLTMGNGSGWFSLDFSYKIREREVRTFEDKVVVQWNTNNGSNPSHDKPTESKKVTKPVKTSSRKITEADLRNVAKSIINK